MKFKDGDVVEHYESKNHYVVARAYINVADAEVIELEGFGGVYSSQYFELVEPSHPPMPLHKGDIVMSDDPDFCEVYQCTPCTQFVVEATDDFMRQIKLQGVNVWQPVQNFTQARTFTKMEPALIQPSKYAVLTSNKSIVVGTINAYVRVSYRHEQIIEELLQDLFCGLDD